MRCGGTFTPRRFEDEAGDLVRRAQSRGEWPGERMTFLLLRDEGGWVDVVGARELFGADLEDGARRVDAAEGGGARSLEAGEGEGGVARGNEGFGGGRGGGGIEVAEGWTYFG